MNPLKVFFTQLTRKAFSVATLMCAAGMCFGQAAPVSLTVTGPYAFKDTPAVATYAVTISNTSEAIVSNIVLSHSLQSADGAYLMAAQPRQGSCDQGGPGITTLTCSVGNLDPGASVRMNLAAMMVSGDIAFSSSAAGIDGNGSAFSAARVQRTTVHGNPPAGTAVVSISLSANPTPKDLVGGRTGTLNWTLQNSTGVRANKLTLTMVIDSRMHLSSSVVSGSNVGDPVSCEDPIPGDPGTNVVFCSLDYLGGSSGGSGGSATVTQLQVTVNYTAPVVSGQTTLQASGYLSFDGSDSSNPLAVGQVRVK